MSEIIIGLDGTERGEDAVDVLVKRSRELELLVIGSRGYAPMRSVLLGGASGRVIRDAECPVIVAPRGAQVALEALLAAGQAAPLRG